MNMEYLAKLEFKQAIKNYGVPVESTEETARGINHWQQMEKFELQKE